MIHRRPLWATLALMTASVAIWYGCILMVTVIWWMLR